MKEFEILWYCGGPEHAPNRVIGRETILRVDLDAAIKYACRKLERAFDDVTELAKGFYVREKK